jgi:hypothetical protein
VVAVVLAGEALERVVVAGDPQAADALDDLAIGRAVDAQASAAREHDRSGAGELSLEHVRVVVAGDEHERAARSDDTQDELLLQR